MPLPNRKIVIRRLRGFGDGLLGVCRGTGKIEIDPRQEEQELFNTFIHELLHREFPDLSEESVTSAANRMSWDLWKQGYRRIRE